MTWSKRRNRLVIGMIGRLVQIIHQVISQVVREGLQDVIFFSGGKIQTFGSHATLKSQFSWLNTPFSSTAVSSPSSFSASLFPISFSNCQIFQETIQDSKTQQPSITNHRHQGFGVLRSMADYSYSHDRSKSYGGPNMMQLQPYYGPPPPPPQPRGDLRSYSVSYAETDMWGTYSSNNFNRDLKLKKGKSTSGSTSKSWSFTDPELQRKKRVASYKMYAVEGKVKGSFRKGFRWLKDRYTRMVYGWW